jgi:2-amino-4-hydroxy-6-hydroxymethyldihydropteridine diphosphokinase
MGSNIDPERNLREAAQLLSQEFPGITFSTVYKTAPQYHEDQEIFLNAVAKAQTEKDPEGILKVLRSIEESLGKSPPFRFGPRTIDLDLLLYGDKILPSLQEWLTNQKLKTSNSKLVVPHERMHERRFVLEPLCELLNTVGARHALPLHPVLQESWDSLLSKTLDQSCDRMRLSL